MELLATSTGDGSYSYDCQGDGKMRNGDNSNSQYGLMGVAAGAAGKLAVPRKYWETALAFWTGRQNSDGGWGYQRDGSRPTMTATGVFSMLVCLEQLGKTRQAALEAQAVKDGMGWLEKHHREGLDMLGDVVGGEGHYYLYAAASAGRPGPDAPDGPCRLGSPAYNRWKPRA